MGLVIIALVSIILLYFLIALSPVKICAICAAVSLTWLGLLVGWLLDWHNNLLLTGILMGGSVVGIMYKSELYFKQRGLSNFWLARIIIIVFGFATVYLLLSQSWGQLITPAAVMVLASFLALFFFKPTARQGQEAAKNNHLKNKLDHCCD